MGFTGDGQATIKHEVGKKIRDRIASSRGTQAAEAAIADAMKTVFKQLAVPPKKSVAGRPWRGPSVDEVADPRPAEAGPDR